MAVQLIHLLWIGILTFVALLIIIFFWTRAQKEKSKIAPVLYVDALKALLAGDDSIAFEKLKAVVTEDSSNIDAYIKIGDILRRRQQPAKALQVHQDLLLRQSLAPATRTEVLKSIALDLMSAENFAKANKVLKEIADHDGKSDWVYHQLLFVCERQKDWESAFEVAERLLKIRKEKDRANLAKYKILQGQKLVEQSEYHKARIAFKEALDFDPQAVAAHLYIGDAYLAERRLEDAVAFWRKVIEVEPKAGFLVFEKLQRALFELGQYNDITSIYQETLKNDPKNVPALYGLGEIFEKKGMIPQAIDQYTAILDIDTRFMPARLNLIRLFRDQKRLDLALDVVESLLEHLSTPSQIYTCKQCRATVSRPIWICPVCRAWNSFDLW